MHNKANDTAYWALRITFGVVPIVAGLDKFVGLLANWPGYVSPFVAGILPMSTVAFMKLVGVIEVIAGALVLTPKTARLGAYVVSAWLVGIAINLLMTGHFFDIAVRDLVMAVGAFSLAKLIEARTEETVTSPATSGFRRTATV